MRKVILFVLICLLQGIVTKNYVDSKTTSVSDRFVRVAERVKDTAVTITVGVSVIDPATKQRLFGRISGSGVFISPNGHILSCAHLFRHDYRVDYVLVHDAYGIEYGAEILSVDNKNDLSLLKVDARIWNFAYLADPRTIKIGQEVVAIGAPLGFDGTVTHGIISSLTRDFGDGYYNLIQSDAAINPGNSGGPLFDLNGNLVGINVLLVTNNLTPSFSGLGFSVNSGQILEFLTKYKGLEVIYQVRRR